MNVFSNGAIGVFVAVDATRTKKSPVRKISFWHFDCCPTHVASESGWFGGAGLQHEANLHTYTVNGCRLKHRRRRGHHRHFVVELTAALSTLPPEAKAKLLAALAEKEDEGRPQDDVSELRGLIPHVLQALHTNNVWESVKGAEERASTLILDHTSN